jgi:hypothetical protein
MTLNKVLDRVKLIAESHNMVNYYFFGDPSDFLSQNETVRHTSVLCTLSSARFDGDRESQTVIGLTISVMDWASGDNHQDIWSDTLQIAHDLLAGLKDEYANDFTVDSGIDLEPFSDRFQDVLVGWTMNVSVTFDSPLNTCAIP